MVSQINVKDANNATVLVATLDAIAALIGEVQASPTANTLLDRQKTLATLATALNGLIGEVQANPTANTLLDRTKTLATLITALNTLVGDLTANPPANTLLARTKAIQDKLVSGVLATAPQSAAHDVRLDWTRPADTTAYAVGDVVGGLKQFANVGANAGGALITGANLLIKVGSFTSGQPTSFRQHFYNAAPATPIADNAAWDLVAADYAIYLGYIDIPAIADMGAAAWYIETNNLNKQIRLATTDVWSYLVTNAIYTPSSGEGYGQTLHTVEI